MPDQLTPEKVTLQLLRLEQSCGQGSKQQKGFDLLSSEQLSLEGMGSEQVSHGESCQNADGFPALFRQLNFAAVTQLLAGVLSCMLLRLEELRTELVNLKLVSPEMLGLQQAVDYKGKLQHLDQKRHHQCACA